MPYQAYLHDEEIFKIFSGSGFHLFDEDGIYIIKLHRDSGQEVVCSMKTGKVVPGNSTFNYGQQSDPTYSLPSGIHRTMDISPHTKWLESKEAYLEMISSGDAGVSEAEAISKAIEAYRLVQAEGKKPFFSEPHTNSDIPAQMSNDQSNNINHIKPLGFNSVAFFLCKKTTGCAGGSKKLSV